MRIYWQRLLAALVASVGILALGCTIYAVSDIRSFEWQPLGELFGLRGVAFIAFILIGLAVITALCARTAIATMQPVLPRSRTLRLGLLLWIAMVGWLAEWVFLEKPVSVRMQDAALGQDHIRIATERAIARFQGDGSLDALSRTNDPGRRAQLALMLGRVAMNRPSVFDDVSIGNTIAKYARRYDLSPVLLLDWAYLDSFYGEAPSGPMPFFREINGELFRDLVQLHLPWWFIESPIRIALIEGPWLDYLVPRGLAWKLRYAFQKATYDIAISPYMNSVYSDLFLILREYRGEFPELFGPGAPRNQIAESFDVLKDNGLLPPYDFPFTQQRRSPGYYRAHRTELITFSRAAVYRLITDFEFATKVQALVAHYYSDRYSEALGADVWARVPERQKTVLLAILRDVDTTNIGTVSYNLYMVPEFNCTPIAYVSAEAARDPAAILQDDVTWLPEDSARFWGATGLMLHGLSEVWATVTGTALPGVTPAATIDDATIVLARQ